MTQLTTNDYKSILEFYKKPIPLTILQIKKQAEKILSTKLCRCINKLKQFKSRAIGICTKTIINNKNLTRGKFTCKKPYKISVTKKRKLR